MGDIALWCQSRPICVCRGRAVPAAKPRCGTMGNLVACAAAMSQIKTPGASSSPVGVRCSVSRNMVAGIADNVTDKT